MKNDKRIEETVDAMLSLCEEYLAYCDNASKCAYADDIVEKIVKKGKELEKLREERFRKGA